MAAKKKASSSSKTTRGRAATSRRSTSSSRRTTTTRSSSGRKATTKTSSKAAGKSPQKSSQKNKATAKVASKRTTATRSSKSSSRTTKAPSAKSAKAKAKTKSSAAAKPKAAAASKIAAPTQAPPVVTRGPAKEVDQRPAKGPVFEMGKGNPPPFVVARGDDHRKVLDEALKYTGFFDHLEELLARSGKRREAFEIVAKVDFMHGVRSEDPPVSYVDPQVVKQIFNELLDRGFRLLRVVASRNELSRYQCNRDVADVGRALGYDESCYELKDLASGLVPTYLGSSLGLHASGLLWQRADCRICIAKNRTDEIFGPALLLYNVFNSLPVPTELVVIERGLNPGEYVMAALQEMPVHFSIIEALHSRDGSPGGGDALELLRDEEGNVPATPEALATNTILAGTDLFAVEAAGQRMQGQDPLEDPWFFRQLRRTAGYKIPAEVDKLPVHSGWRSLGTQIRNVLDLEKPAETRRYSLWQLISHTDSRLFPPQPGGHQRHRLKGQVDKYFKELRETRGHEAISADVNGSG